MSGLPNALVSQKRWLSFLNTSGEEVPPYAIIQLVDDPETDTDTYNFKQRLLFTQPDETVGDNNKTFALNSRAAVQDGKYGSCTFAYDAPAWARLTSDSNDGSTVWDMSNLSLPWVGEEWGPKEAEWNLHLEGGGFIICGPPDLDKGRILVRQISGNGAIAKFKLAVDQKVFYGGRDTGGVKYLAKGTRVFSVDDDGSPLTYGSGTEDILCKERNDLLYPGDIVDCVKLFGKWFPLSPGAEVFTNCVANEDIDPNGDVAIHGDTSFVVDAEQPITGEPVPTGSTVTLRWNAEEKIFQVDGTACPPT